MITLDNPDYKTLARASSNQMLRYDAEWLQGNYEEAGLAIWEAGLLRLQMAILGRRAEDPARAAADFLSAASCFLKAGNLKWAERALKEADELGPPPPERPDLQDARAERVEQLAELADRQKQFHAELNQQPQWLETRPVEVLAPARERLRDFPGWARLYSLLAFLETRQADLEAAARHALLAARFDPDNPLLVCVALLARAKVEPLTTVLEWGREQRKRFQEDTDIRVVLTYLQAVYARQRQDYQDALRVLEPLALGRPLSLAQMAIILSLCAFLAKELGEAAVYAEVTKRLSSLRTQLPGSPLSQPLVAELNDLIESAGAGNLSLRRSLQDVEKGLLLMAYAA